MKNVELIPRGFSTLELLLALMILSTTLTAVVLISLGIPSALADGHEKQVGMQLASSMLEKEFLVGRSSFSSVVSSASSSALFNGKGYETSLTVNFLPDGITKKLTSFVSWIDAKGQAQYEALSGIITDFNGSGVASCSPVLLGNWTRPQESILSLTPGSLLPAESSIKNYPLQTLAVEGNTLIAGVGTSDSRTDPTLFFFNISSSTAPAYLGSLDTATSTHGGFAALAAQGNLLYGASSDNPNFDTCIAGSACSQLQIIDMTDAASSTVVENFKLATSSAPYAGGSGGQSAGKSIFYVKGIVYLGLQKTGTSGGDEFNIINVQDPQAPVWLGGYSVGRTVNQIKVLGDYAYLATDDPSRELIILNIHDPEHIAFAGSYDAPGNTAFGFGETLAIASSSNSSPSGTPLLILGRSYILNQPQFSLFDISSTSPALLGSEPVGATSTESIDDITLQSFLAAVLTSTSLEFWNIADPSAPTPYAASISLPGIGGVVGPNGLVCSGNALYVASTDFAHTGYISVITGS